MKYDKELEWLCPEPLNIKRWERHACYKIVTKYADLLHGTVADFGCNNGIVSCMLSNIPNVDYVIGFDISDVALADGERVIGRHIKCRPDKIFFRYSDLTTYIDSDDNAFDAAICFHTLEHIYPEDLDNTLEEMHRVMRPLSKLVFSLPCRDAFPCAAPHVSHFDLSPGKYIDLPGLFALHGFRVEDIYEDGTLDSRQQLCITGVVTCMP